MQRQDAKLRLRAASSVYGHGAGSGAASAGFAPKLWHASFPKTAVSARDGKCRATRLRGDVPVRRTSLSSMRVIGGKRKVTLIYIFLHEAARGFTSTLTSTNFE